MARYSLFLGTILLLAGCAEIVPLTGGPTDTRAALPVSNSQIPEQGALHVSQNELTVRFDEFFTLNDPTNTAVMNPNAGKLEVTSKKRDLTIKWDGTLQPNTTYIIQLNGTIKDLNEKNDTIHQFVFSTGNQIDSLKVSGMITDGFTNKPGSSYSVGLYPADSDPYKNPPMYICKSDAKGAFEFNYLKQGNFQLFAYLDANKDRLPTIGEDIAYTSTLVTSADSSYAHILSSKPKVLSTKMQIKIANPGVATLFGKEIKESLIKLNGESINLIKQYSIDSALIALPIVENDIYTFVVEQDTITKILPIKDRNKNFSIINKVYKSSWLLGDTLLFQTNERIDKIDTSLIILEDKTKLKVNYNYLLEGNLIKLIPTTEISFDLIVQFKSGALKGISNQNDSIKLEIKTFHPSDLSNLKLGIESLKGKWIIQLMEGNNPIRTFQKSETDTVVEWNNLIPVVYQIRCIRDINGNGKWDAGNWIEKSQPEEVVRFDIKSKLRPNWDIEEVLKLDLNE
ncbi:Ig-like domain-containing protein [Fluviicola taffensis]|uniref:SbsA Ig-like domain-containing protein n=1 Tax=Fluviicola taffensis (strain DSM 16823 / NCIMB 13979 / RW262) TaxID=755732 RepID=F2IBD0_FLUTR|nr:Ig-like domain-containing protein [Fluviicola taffensis]AEA43216.1 hypothetical protein Fluta_1221 [Fluviicola taffensis DSM 16823]